MMKRVLSSIRLWGPSSKQGLVWIAIAFALDQVSKHAVLALLQSMDVRIISVAPFLDLVMGWNKGVSYGFFQMETLEGRLLLILFALAAMTFLWNWLAKTPPERTKSVLALALILGGAAGNLLDRILFGAVSDFLSFHAFGFYWYVFNIADLEITLGVVLILWDEIAQRGRDGEEPQAP